MHTTARVIYAKLQAAGVIHSYVYDVLLGEEKLLKRIGEAASKALGKPNGKLYNHYGIVMLDAAAYIQQLIDQCARSTFVF